MNETKYCYIHNVPTKLSCSSCSKPICPDCMVNSAVGYKCKECALGSKTHIEEISTTQYVHAGISGLVAGILAGFLWNLLSNLGVFFNIITAYAVGFIIAKTITKTIGNKYGIKIQVLAGIITFISLVLNPVNAIINMQAGIALPVFIFSSIFGFLNLYGIITIVIAVWASVRHFKF